MTDQIDLDALGNDYGKYPWAPSNFAERINPNVTMDDMAHQPTPVNTTPQRRLIGENSSPMIAAFYVLFVLGGLASFTLMEHLLGKYDFNKQAADIEQAAGPVEVEVIHVPEPKPDLERFDRRFEPAAPVGNSK